jgi:6-pyruvoyltetrahydropterin/6-carboxytetrahydropterin synthase
MSYKYTSTKTYRQIAPCAYRQWRADSHCNQIHGYAFSFHFEFGTNELDARNWSVDYGSLRPLKDKLEEWFDHALLLAEDDPNFEDIKKLGDLKLAKITIVEKTGCEGLAEFLYDYVNEQFLPTYGYGDRVWCTRVEVRETDSNMAYVSGDRPNAN